MGKKLSPLKRVILERDRLRKELRKGYHQFVPPGHFCSPLPSLDEVALREEEIFNRVPKRIPGILYKGSGLEM